MSISDLGSRLWPTSNDLAAMFEDLFSRLRGRPSAADGWEAVATEGDDNLEMTQTRTNR